MELESQRGWRRQKDKGWQRKVERAREALDGAVELMEETVLRS
jgi:hypothetical protein